MKHKKLPEQNNWFLEMPFRTSERFYGEDS